MTPAEEPAGREAAGPSRTAPGAARPAESDTFRPPPPARAAHPMTARPVAARRGSVRRTALRHPLARRRPA
ncbi:hypothetical protein GCM10018781_22950 [Kitasatospora indigofera]|uniref:Uncharacterized protein n=1 Tax=Kitasatospora indigofera TaxID=67307 RepID=A0A919FKN4_9ACTN|nr:hypothetical protein GCM10018781_22950 [Kitasatospora indigofera]